MSVEGRVRRGWRGRWLPPRVRVSPLVPWEAGPPSQSPELTGCSLQGSRWWPGWELGLRAEGPGGLQGTEGGSQGLSSGSWRLGLGWERVRIGLGLAI